MLIATNAMNVGLPQLSRNNAPLAQAPNCGEFTQKTENLCQQEQSTSCASYHPQFLTEREAASDIGFRLALGGQTTNCRVITLMPSPISNLEVALVGINRIQQLFHPLIQVFDRQTHYV